MELLFGIDGGGTHCRARLTRGSGEVLGEGRAGPANLRLGLDESLAAVRAAAQDCLVTAGLPMVALTRARACLALAGASEPGLLRRVRARPLPFGRTVVTTDAHAACLGAHRGRDGGIIIIGTGTIGWAIIGGRQHRVGGWGFPLADEGSGAWLGAEAVRHALRAHDGGRPWTPLLQRVFARFDHNPHGIVAWATTARPGDFGRFAPLVIEEACAGDAVAVALCEAAARHVDALAARLAQLGARRLALSGGLSGPLERWLSPETRRLLVAPAGDALAGALWLARAEDPALVEG